MISSGLYGLVFKIPVYPFERIVNGLKFNVLEKIPNELERPVPDAWPMYHAFDTVLLVELKQISDLPPFDKG